MTFERWAYQIEVYERAVAAKQEELEAVEKERDEFFRSTIGFVPGSVATLTGTVQMIGKIIDMKKEKEPPP